VRRWGVGQDRLDFVDFYLEARDGCLRAVMATAGNPEVAEDLVADAFAKAWSSWPKVSRHPSPSAWVVRVALNAGVSRWRKQRWERALGDHDSVTPGVQSEAVDVALLMAVRRLPQRQREVIALRVFLDLDTEATAGALGIAPGTVTAHLARATATLRGELTDERPVPRDTLRRGRLNHG
jgi:RNA polymerase sigma factor (sigma-70 family)